MVQVIPDALTQVPLLLASYVIIVHLSKLRNQ